MGAAFAITEVDFVDATFTITNVGDEAGNLDGYAVCQRPNYSTIADVSLEPGESIAIDASEVGGFVPENGEVALYTDRSFDDSQAIVSYVEWGSPGHGRSSVAIDAGIWQEDAAVSTTGDTKLMTTNGEVATTPAEWEVG
jgi:hypothetical protein